MIPTGLKIGDTYTEEAVDGKVFLSKITGFDGQGRYLSEFIGMVPKDKAPLEEKPLPLVEEVTPIEEMLAEMPVEEKPKKAPARKPATRRKKK